MDFYTIFLNFEVTFSSHTVFLNYEWTDSKIQGCFMSLYSSYVNIRFNVHNKEDSYTH